MRTTDEDYADESTRAIFLAVAAVSLAVLGVIFRRIAYIRKNPTDYLAARRFEAQDIALINEHIGTGSEAVVQAIVAAYAKTMDDTAKEAAKAYRSRGIEQIPWRENKLINQSVSLSRANTARLAERTLLNALLVDLNGEAVPIKIAYRSAIDQAIRTTRLGEQSFERTVNKTIATMTNGRMVVVPSETGRMLRLDSMIRRNAWSGLSQTIDEVNQIQADEYGADGIEISAHMGSAEDHAPFQGGQYSRHEAKMVKGQLYESFPQIQANLARPFLEYNCRHRISYIILGISEPAYSKTELKRLYSETTTWHGISGKKMDGSLYDAAQYQRTLEAAIRKKRFELEGQYAAQMPDAALTEARIKSMMSQYNGISHEMGLTPQTVRTRIK